MVNNEGVDAGKAMDLTRLAAMLQTDQTNVDYCIRWEGISGRSNECMRIKCSLLLRAYEE